MNSNVHPLVVVLVLLLTGIAIVTWMWGSDQAARIGGPAELKMDPRGHVYLQIQNELLEHDAIGAYVATHDLADLGVELFLGSFDFFSNGDILLRRGPDPRSFADNIRAFLRRTNRDSIAPETPESGLFRCQLLSKACAQFGATPIDFKAAHGIYIDRETDEVYISDTTRHVLRKYASDGTAVAEPVAGFKFPNQLLLHDQQLIVVDTNHHQIRLVSAATSTFGEDIDSKRVTPVVAKASGQIWPSHFARVGKEWWVNNMSNGMDAGGIFVFDDDWQFTRRLELPTGADPIALIAVGDVVWVSDWNNDKVHRFSEAGEPLAALNSRGLADILLRSKDERRKFELTSYSGVVFLLLILGGLAVRAFALGQSAISTPAVPATAEVRTVQSDLHFVPDEKVLKKMSLAIRFLIILIAALVFALGYTAFVVVPENFQVETILPVFVLVLLVPLMAWIKRSNTGTSIRVQGDVVTLRDYSGRESSCALADVRYDDFTIATQDVVVFLGRPMASIYDRTVLERDLFPRLSAVPKSSPIEMQKFLLQQWHPQGVSVLIVIFVVIVAVLLAVLK